MPAFPPPRLLGGLSRGAQFVLSDIPVFKSQFLVALSSPTERQEYPERANLLPAFDCGVIATVALPDPLGFHRYCDPDDRDRQTGLVTCFPTQIPSPRGPTAAKIRAPPEPHSFGTGPSRRVWSRKAIAAWIRPSRPKKVTCWSVARKAGVRAGQGSFSIACQRRTLVESLRSCLLLSKALRLKLRVRHLHRVSLHLPFSLQQFPLNRRITRAPAPGPSLRPKDRKWGWGRRSWSSRNGRNRRQLRAFRSSPGGTMSRKIPTEQGNQPSHPKRVIEVLFPPAKFRANSGQAPPTASAPSAQCSADGEKRSPCREGPTSGSFPWSAGIV